MRLFLSLALCLASLPALANDGWGGLAATGLTFGQTDAVAMQEEDLFISQDEIRVDYVFKNITAKDVTGEVIFPLPPISLAASGYSDWNLPDDRGLADLVGFTATVNGAAQSVTIDRIAVIEPEWQENTPLAQQYDTPGRDMTAELAALGLPLSIDFASVTEALLALPAETRAAVQAAGLAEYIDGGEGYPAEVVPLWSVVLRYHWTQTFPAGAEMRISHAYANRAPGGIFPWEHPAPDYRQPEVARYCIDEGTSKALYDRLQHPDLEPGTAMGMAYNIAYVLRTANSWAGPIGRFKLTIDKGAAENVISLCADGVQKTGPTTFVVERTNYTPDRDLEILLALPMYPAE